MKNILICCNYFKPGYKAGGPIQSTYNLCMLIKGMVNLKVVTQNFDLDQSNYDLPTSVWIDKGGFEVMYLTKKKFLLFPTNASVPDIIYLNSFFSLSTQIYLFILKCYKRSSFKRATIIVAPRGEFDRGALSIRKVKKDIFLSFFKILKISNLKFHATTSIEANNIKSLFKNKYPISIAGNVPKIPHRNTQVFKDSLKTEFYFFSRISPKKNLKFALNIFSRVIVEGEIHFNVIGPIEDNNYWKECLSLVENLPHNIYFKYIGEIRNEDLHTVLSSSHYLFLPTLGENYGHVIFESLALGKPVLLSDQTPWLSEAHDDGLFTASLNDEAFFIDRIKELHAYSNAEYSYLSSMAYKKALNYADLEQIKNQYIKLFNI